MSFDVQTIRQDFPILKTEARGMPLVYLDHAATSQKPKNVIQSIVDYYENYNANAHRGVHDLSERATAAFESARDQVVRFIDAPSRDEIVFVRGATEGFNLVAQGYGDLHLRGGDTVLVTRLEHHANFVPWQQLCERISRRDSRAVRFEIVELTSDGQIDFQDLEKKLSLRPKIFSLSLMSNLLGVLNPVKKIAEMAKAAGVDLVMVDAAQAVAHHLVRVSDLGPIDALAFSGHKILAPTGIGVLWARRSLLNQMQPVFFGGHMIHEVLDQATRFGELPTRFEAGTAHIEGVIGLGAALRYLEKLPYSSALQYENELGAYAFQKLREISELKLLGPSQWTAERAPVFGFTVEGVHTQDLAQFLDLEGIAVRSGHMCLQPYLRSVGLTSVVRASFSYTNTRAEVDLLNQSIRKAIQYFEKLKLRQTASNKEIR